MRRFLGYMMVCWVLFTSFHAPTVKIARLKYQGGGDWYVSPTALPNLIAFCNDRLETNLYPEEDIVEVGSPDIFNYPFVHMTGHGNVVFSEQEAENLREYLLAGGFLSINDSYGMDDYIRSEMKKVFPNKEFVELPYDHEIYDEPYDFPTGVPKIHRHDGKAARGYGIIHEGRLVCFYNYEADIGDGWEDQEVHNDPQEVRLKALKMGANLMRYAFEH